jgi:glycosyltransferase involved in cell wall biosynthesis
MIRVGFIPAVSKEWMGGLNYFKNLFYAINEYKKSDIEIYIFTGNKIDKNIKEEFKKYGNIVQDAMFDTGSLTWWLWKISDRLFSTQILLEFVLKKYKLDVLSHSSVVNSKKFKTINWIPDFQYIHLPNMFSKKEINNLNRRYKKFSDLSDGIILSSFDALNDYKNIYQNKQNSHVLHFVSQPSNIGQLQSLQHKEEFFRKYQITDKYFYVPNQFWKHKNHIVVFESVKILSEQGIQCKIICTGHLKDYRNEEHIHFLQSFIENNELSDNIKLLGLVPYEDVFNFIQYSQAVINPSLFEGWSSTVEECKSVQKNMILSNINVHKEQYPSATFFSKDDSIDLANILANYEPVVSSEISQELLVNRTYTFAEQYHNILKRVLQ